ncbi:MAG: FAD-dependent tricarballylate dehydrogenase TcuA [Ferrimicrobium sp.]
MGGGNAALVAAISARSSGRSVIMIERSPMEMRGGNTRHTRNIRCVHAHADEFNTGSYLFEELWADLCSVGTGPSDEKLAALTVRESETVPPWMAAQGISWQKPLTGTLQLGRTNRFFLGGGKALANSYYQTAKAIGVKVLYDTSVVDLDIVGDRCQSLTLHGAGAHHKLTANAVICAAGGFEANIEWLSRYWGDAAANYRIRGAVTNDGAILASLYSHGAASAGEEKGFHAVAVDARSPLFDGGIATRIDAIPFGIVVDKNGERFYDEGEDVWPKRYAIWGRLIAQAPDQIAYALWDSQVNNKFLPPMYGPEKADTLEEVAKRLQLDPATVARTVSNYNNAIPSGGILDPSKLDGCHTNGLVPPKSNWAHPIDTPPYYGIAMRPGITFTYMGVKITESAKVLRQDGGEFANVFAAGEIMSGNILSTGYLAGFGLTIGTVWGRIAGKEAANAAIG